MFLIHKSRLTASDMENRSVFMIKDLKNMKIMGKSTPKHENLEIMRKPDDPQK